MSSCDEASLRAAMNGGGLVTFACDGTITLTNPLVMATDTVLNATGHEVTLDGNSQIRILTVPANLVCTIAGLRIANGRTTNEAAGVLNSGTLTFQGCTFSNNVAAAGFGGIARGGALLNNGTLNVQDCTFIANQATVVGNGNGLGGAIRSAGTLSVNACAFVQNYSTGSGGAISVSWPVGRTGITNCTFYANSSLWQGSAIYAEIPSPEQFPINIVNCTLSQNAGVAIEGGLGSTWIANSIVAGGTCFATDGGNNLFAPTSDPRLEPLADNGGPTLTLEPLADSPAIDQGNNLVCPPTDQRGVARPIRARCDIGAVETSVSPAPPVLQFASAVASVNEDTSNATLDVVRLGNSGPTVSVNYTTANGTAVAGQDYGFTSGTLNFGFGQTNATITVPILNDLVPESAETVQVTLSAPSAGASLGSPVTMTLTIQDDDRQAVTNCDEASLRAALSRGGLITFACDGTITLSNTLVIGKDMTLDASGHQVILNGANAVQVVKVSPGVRFVMTAMTVANGGGTANGAGLYNSGDSTLLGCTFTNNRAAGYGGAIYQDHGSLLVSGCTFLRNNASGPNGLGGAIAGGNILVTAGPSGPLDILNSTFVGNSAGTAGGIFMDCGAYWTNGPVRIVNCTLAENTNGAVWNCASSSTMTLWNTILGDNPGANCSGIIDGGHNLSWDSSPSLTNVTTRTNTDPKLTALADNGGPTLTMALLPDSPAIDAGDGSICQPTDQRGSPRPYGAACDIGAFETVFIGTNAGIFQFTASDYTVREDEGSATITVFRNHGALGVVTVDFATSDGTATDGVDYTATNGTLSFASGEVSKSFVVRVTSDGQPESPETVNLTLANPTGGAGLGTPSQALLTLLDEVRTLTTCDESSLRAAVNAGGTVLLACDGTIALSSPITISNAVALDATGHNVTISGSNAVRLFNINPGAQLRLLGLTLADGNAAGTNGNAGQPGGIGVGGAIYNNGGVLAAEDCLFTHNRAQGGTGGPALGVGSAPGAGGAARGGVGYNAGGGAITATRCAFVLNSAVGGAVGPGSLLDSTRGGDAAGGALFNANGSLDLGRCSVVTNSVLSGEGRRWGGLNVNDAAQGGAICSLSGDVTLTQVELAGNSCVAPYMSGASGGAISHSGGALILVGSYLQANRVEGGLRPAVGGVAGTGGPAFGGALCVTAGAARLVNSTLADNLALGGPGLGGVGGPAFGGGLYQARGSTVAMTNCTLSANQAQGGPASHGGNGYGGALCVSEGPFVASHVTLAGNFALSSPSPYGGPSLGGGIYSTNGSVTLRNSILANNLSGSNWFGTTLVDDGNNLSSDASCPFTAPGSLSNVDPLLAPLDDFGGPTPTMALLAGSPALNAANPAWCPPTDQRGVARPYGAACDIGAFESAPPYTIRGGIAGYLASPGGCGVICSSRTSPVDPETGRYVVWDIVAGSHLVIPQASQAVFEPNDRTVDVSADVVGVNFHAWRSNALSIEPVSGPVFRNVFAGAAGDTWRLMRSTNLLQWELDSAHTVGPNGLFEFRLTNAPALPPTFFETEKP